MLDVEMGVTCLTGRGAPRRLAPQGAGGGRGASQSPSTNQPGPRLDCRPVASNTERAVSVSEAPGSHSSPALDPKSLV